jgi:hypothetical protein
MNNNSLLTFSKTSSIFCLLIVLFGCESKKNGNSVLSPLLSWGGVDGKNYIVYDALSNLDFMDTMKIKDYYKQNFEPLSDSLKIIYLSEYFEEKTGRPFTKEMLTTDLKAFLVACLHIGSFYKPTIIKIYGKDYIALVLANMNRYGTVISGETLYNYKLRNPQIENDTLIVTQPKYKFDFKFNGWVIIYEKTIGTILINPNTKKRDYFIDKTIYETRNNESGASHTKIIEKSRISQKFEIEDFQSY